MAAYQAAGPHQLAIYLAQVNRTINGDLHLADMQGKDLVTAQDVTGSLNTNRQFMGVPRMLSSKLALRLASPDGRYQLVGTVYTESPESWARTLRFFFIVTTVSSLLCWIVTVVLFVRPLKSLSKAMERYGEGDLDVRANYSRTDEIGDVARTFDAMAGHIQSLLLAQRQILQDISHELRSPLARLCFAVEVMQTSENPNFVRGQIKKDVKRLSDLVDGILEVIRLERVPEVCADLPVSIAEVCRTVVSDCVVEARAKGCEVTIDAEWQGEMYGDRELFRRAIENVLRNAIRYAPPQTDIDVSINIQRGLTDLAVVAVRDFGPGVPEDSLVRLFEPFFRVEGARELSKGGVGLGLAITHRAIGAHHGKITAENAEPGLRIKIYIPVASSLRPPELVVPAIQSTVS